MKSVLSRKGFLSLMGLILATGALFTGCGEQQVDAILLCGTVDKAGVPMASTGVYFEVRYLTRGNYHTDRRQVTLDAAGKGCIQFGFSYGGPLKEYALKGLAAYLADGSGVEGVVVNDDLDENRVDYSVMRIDAKFDFDKPNTSGDPGKLTQYLIKRALFGRQKLAIRDSAIENGFDKSVQSSIAGSRENASSNGARKVAL